MFEIKTTTAKTTITRVTMTTETIRVGSIFHLKIEKLILGMVELVWCEFRTW